jgi:biopolymer transport protein TolQ
MGSNLGNNMSIWHLIFVADPVVKLVMLILLLASVISWSIIFQRSRLLSSDQKKFESFERKFWAGQSLPELYKSVDQTLRSSENIPVGAEHIFMKGYEELLKLDRRGKIKPEAVISGVERTMKVALMRESDRLQSGISLLASIGSVSPYVGLFGTVWGIMNAFQSLGAVSQATLSMVAPGISEALIATAMGLFVAIPAVIAYNRFVARSESLLNEYENFQEEFTGLLHREVYSQDFGGEKR